MMIVYGSTNRILTFRGTRDLAMHSRVRFALSRKRGATVDNLLHRLILFVIIDVNYRAFTLSFQFANIALTSDIFFGRV